MYFIRISLLMLILFLAACSANATPEATPMPDVLVRQAADNIRTVSTVKLTIDRDGAEYLFESELGSVIFNRLEAQYVAPDTIQATTRVTLGQVPLDIEIFAKGENQWIRLSVNAAVWQKSVFAPGFNPEILISQENSGLQQAMASLKNVRQVGEEQLEDGTAVYHLSADAAGADVSALIANLIQMTGQVQVDLYIDREKRLPLKFVVLQPDSVTEAQKEPTTWTIEIYDFDIPATLDEPADVVSE